MRGRRAEERDHRVADELLDGAAEALELGAKVRVVGGEQRADVLGVELLRARGEPDEIGEEHGDDLPLLAGRGSCGFERSATGVAEARAGRVLLAAAGTDDHASSVRLPRASF